VVFFFPWTTDFICFIIALTALKGGMEESLLQLRANLPAPLSCRLRARLGSCSPSGAPRSHGANFSASFSSLLKPPRGFSNARDPGQEPRAASCPKIQATQPGHAQPGGPCFRLHFNQRPDAKVSPHPHAVLLSYAVPARYLLLFQNTDSFFYWASTNWSLTLTALPGMVMVAFAH